MERTPADDSSARSHYARIERVYDLSDVLRDPAFKLMHYVAHRDTGEGWMHDRDAWMRHARIGNARTFTTALAELIEAGFVVRLKRRPIKLAIGPAFASQVAVVPVERRASTGSSATSQVAVVPVECSKRDKPIERDVRASADWPATVAAWFERNGIDRRSVPGFDKWAREDCRGRSVKVLDKAWAVWREPAPEPRRAAVRPDRPWQGVSPLATVPTSESQHPALVAERLRRG